MFLGPHLVNEFVQSCQRGVPLHCEDISEPLTGAPFKLSWIFWGIQKVSLWSPCPLSSPFIFILSGLTLLLSSSSTSNTSFPHPPVAILEDGWIMYRPLRHHPCANNVGMSSRRHPIPLSNDTMEDIGRCWLSAATAEILMSIEADFPPPSSHCQPFHPFSITWYGPSEPQASRQRRAREGEREAPHFPSAKKVEQLVMPKC